MQATSDILTNLLSDETCSLPWPHVRLMVRGTGGAGKTTTIDSIAGETVRPSRIAVGAKMLDFELLLRDVVLVDAGSPLRPYVPEAEECSAALAAFAVSQVGDVAERTDRPSMLDAVKTAPSFRERTSHSASAAPAVPESLTLPSSPRSPRKSPRPQVARPSSKLLKKYSSR